MVSSAEDTTARCASTAAWSAFDAISWERRLFAAARPAISVLSPPALEMVDARAASWNGLPTGTRFSGSDIAVQRKLATPFSLNAPYFSEPGSPNLLTQFSAISLIVAPRRYSAITESGAFPQSRLTMSNLFSSVFWIRARRTASETVCDGPVSAS